MTSSAKEYYAKSEGTITLSWEDVENDVLKIIDDMKHDGFEPDIIVSIARSGLIPASMIAYALGNKQLYVIKVDFSKVQKNGQDQELNDRPIITQELTKDIQGLKVLVVDEMVVSGSTLKLVDAYMGIKNPGEVRYAVLYKQPWAEFKPQYSGREVTEWPLYPWKELRNNVLDPRAKTLAKTESK
ncbi:MAG: phosphoribosyltransferase family protein [Candidatus Magasanikbacteria bacterium]